jgi:hypothetical protein
MRPSRKDLLPVAGDIERAMDRRDAAGAEQGVVRLLRMNRAMVIDLVARPATSH